jgi:hypothetical protein
VTTLRALARNGYWMPLTIAALVGILVWDRGWFWFMLLAAAIGVGPWFACSRLLDRIGELEDDNMHLAAELDQALGRLAEALNEIPPLELVPFDSLSKPERDHIKAAASKITAASLRPSLHIVEPVGGDVPVADEPTPIHDRALIDAWIEDVQTWGEDVER